jgi:translation initiation factor 1 (eIF-1/SUI1)
LPIRQWLKKHHPEVVAIMRLTRWESQLFKVRIVSRFSPSQIKLRRELSNATELKLHLACGGNRVEGWINIDGSPGADMRADLRRPLPLPFWASVTGSFAQAAPSA